MLRGCFFLLLDSISSMLVMAFFIITFIRSGFKLKTADVASPLLVTDSVFTDSKVSKVTTSPKDTGARSKVKVSTDSGVDTETPDINIRDTRSAGNTPIPRKRLPPIPDSEKQAAMATINNKQNGNGGSGYGPLLVEYSLMAEYSQLHKQKLPGVYVIPSASERLVWNGVLFIRQGLYQGGIFRFSLRIPENYPDGDCPRVLFDYPVFHPLVEPKTGELDVKRGFPKWKRNTHQLWQVLLYARRVFHKIDTKSPWEQEAADLYDHDIEQFKKRVCATVQDSKDGLYDPVESQDPHTIRFTKWDPSVHEAVRDEMLRPKRSGSDGSGEPHRRNGMSWMRPGSSQIFSRHQSSPAR